MSEEKRFFLFLILTFVVVMGMSQLFRHLWPPAAPAPRPAAQQPQEKDEQVAQPPAAADADRAQPPEAPAGKEPGPAAEAVPALVEQPPEEVRLGSTDPADGFEFAVTLSNRGAAVRKIVMSDPKFRDESRRDQLALISVPDTQEGSFLLGLKGSANQLEQCNWEIVQRPQQDKASAESDAISFRTRLPERGLEITKTYRLNKQSFKLELSIEIHNRTSEPRDVVYYLGGPRGFVLEGAWYASKLRDVVIGGGPGGSLSKRPTVPAAKLVKGAKKRRDELLEKSANGQLSKGDWNLPSEFGRYDLDGNGKLSVAEMEAAANRIPDSDFFGEATLRFAGVEGQYFCVLLVTPSPSTEPERRDHATRPMLVKHDSAHPERSDVSVETESRELPIPAGGALQHDFTVYAGPRNRDVVMQALADRVLVQFVMNYQGWFFLFPAWIVSGVANLLLGVLGFYHVLVGNWGLAIILLTVTVRLLMFPLSRHQTMNAVKMQQKMALFKPEMDRLKEKHKNNPQELGRAQMELMRKHGVNPLKQVGCLPVLLQMPIFIGLWQGLSSSVDLRQAKFVAWIDNLAAPDALFRWGENIPLLSWALGPYFNLLPAILIVLFVIQQKMFAPPKPDPPDPQVEMQQKMMMWMMAFFGYIFWRLPSGLCLYYIASTSWGLAERKLLMKWQPAGPSAAAVEKKDKVEAPRKAPVSSGRDGRGPGRDGKGRRALSSANGQSWSDWFKEILKKASKR